MRLTTIEPHHYGPFAFATTLQVEPDVTVLTGPNDAGKTSLLRLIYRICEEGNVGVAEESEFNLDNIHERPTGWQADTDFGAIVTFAMTTGAAGKYQLHPPFVGAEEITVKCCIAPSNRTRMVIAGKKNNQTITGTSPLTKMPRAIRLPPPHEVRDM